MVKSLTSSSFFGSVTTVNDTDCELLAVGGPVCRFENQAEFFGRNGLGRDRAVRPARFAQQQDLFGCGRCP